MADNDSLKLAYRDGLKGKEYWGILTDEDEVRENRRALADRARIEEEDRLARQRDVDRREYDDERENERQAREDERDEREQEREAELERRREDHDEELEDRRRELSDERDEVRQEREDLSARRMQIEHLCMQLGELGGRGIETPGQAILRKENERLRTEAQYVSSTLDEARRELATIKETERLQKEALQRQEAEEQRKRDDEKRQLREELLNSLSPKDIVTPEMPAWKKALYNAAFSWGKRKAIQGILEYPFMVRLAYNPESGRPKDPRVNYDCLPEFEYPKRTEREHFIRQWQRNLGGLVSWKTRSKYTDKPPLREMYPMVESAAIEGYSAGALEVVRGLHATKEQVFAVCIREDANFSDPANNQQREDAAAAFSENYRHGLLAESPTFSLIQNVRRFELNGYLFGCAKRLDPSLP